MANTILTPQIIAREALMVLRNNTVMSSLVYRDYSSEFTKVGDTITIRKPATFTAKEFTDAIEVQDAIESGIEVTMDKHLDVSFSVSSKQKTLDIADFSAQLLVPAMQAFAQQIDTYLVALGETVKNVVTRSTDPAIKDFALCGKDLNDRAVPNANRYMVLSPAAYADYVVLPPILNAEKSGTTETLRNASMGKIMGFETYMDQNVKTKNLAFHKNAFALVTRPLELPQGGAKASSVTYDGFGLRVVMDYDITHKTDIVSIDMLCGVAMLDERLACRLDDAAAPAPPAGK